MTDDARYRKALRTPSGIYSRPADVLGDDSLNDAQKREILEHWEAEAVELQESEAEGFTGGERSLLGDIKQALKALRD